MHVAAPCKHSEVENLRRVFESLDKDGTGSVKFDIFLRKSGMKPEVAKGFVHEAAREGVNDDMYVPSNFAAFSVSVEDTEKYDDARTFPRLVKILYPKLAPYYRKYQPPINRKLAIQKAQREEAAAAAASGVLRNVEDLLNGNEISELRELFRILNRDGGPLLSTKVVAEAFRKNGLCGEDELVSMLSYRESQKGFLTEDEFVSIIGQYYPTVTLQEFIQDSIKTFEEQREIKSRQRRRQAQLANKPSHTTSAALSPDGASLPPGTANGSNLKRFDADPPGRAPSAPEDSPFPPGPAPGGKGPGLSPYIAGGAARGASESPALLDLSAGGAASPAQSESPGVPVSRHLSEADN